MLNYISHILLPVWLLAVSVSSPTKHEPQLSDTDTRAIVKAAYLYNFGTQCDWPASTKDKHFQIAILGNDPIYAELATKYIGKPVGGQSLEVLLLGSTDEIDQPHILYVSKDAQEDLADIAELVKDQSVMIVTEQSGALDLGALVNFVVVESVIKFELNSQLAGTKGITLGSNIVHWAVQP